MKKTVFYFHGNNAALEYAAAYLHHAGATVVLTPGPDVTHLVLPVPSFDEDGRIRGGGSIFGILGELSEDVTIIGGGLGNGLLAQYRALDLLHDPDYVTANAAITAHCCVKLLYQRLPTVPADMKMLIIGWGRIGKCLARLLRGLDVNVTVAARNPRDRAMLGALGYDTADPGNLDLQGYRVIINTAPAQVLTESQASAFRGLKIDLASTVGIPGADVVRARGLPGRDAPESAGNLIGRTILRLAQKEVAS